MKVPPLRGMPLRLTLDAAGRAGCPQPAPNGAVRTPRPTQASGSGNAERDGRRPWRQALRPAFPVAHRH
jgi:hypothetical protein